MEAASSRAKCLLKFEGRQTAVKNVQNKENYRRGAGGVNFQQVLSGGDPGPLGRSTVRSGEEVMRCKST